IKTPQTPLLAPEYRQDVFPPSQELTGALAQVLHYRDTFTQQFQLVTQDEPSWLAVEPRCVVLAGSSLSTLSGAHRKSFELYRDRLAGVAVITFDELFARVEGLIALLESTEDAAARSTA